MQHNNGKMNEDVIYKVLWMAWQFLDEHLNYLNIKKFGQVNRNTFLKSRLYNPVMVNVVDSKIRTQNDFDKLNIFLVSRMTLRLSK